MEEVPPQIFEIAKRLGRNERLRRRSVVTLLSWFGAARRGIVVIPKIREALLSAGLETDPDFTEGSVNDFITFRLIEGAKKAASQTGGLGGRKQPQADPMPGANAERETIQTIPRSDQPSDDFLEPELDDEPQMADDDHPVVSIPADWTITALREKWDAGLLDLQPHFQREYVWRLKPELPSRLIESILLEIPIPPLYFGRLDGGKLEVIDGQQRLTTLIEFITNKFAIQRLTRMPSLNGYTFRELSKEYQEKIKDTPIRTVQINAGNNPDLRYEIFERLNRGSMGLNEQELRNCVFRGKFNVLLAELEGDSKWRNVKGGDAPEPRFKEREMILRFLALANRGGFYKGGLKRFLNDYMAKYAPRERIRPQLRKALQHSTGKPRRKMGHKILDCCARNTGVRFVRTRPGESSEGSRSNPRTFSILVVNKRSCARCNIAIDWWECPDQVTLDCVQIGDSTIARQRSDRTEIF